MKIIDQYVLVPVERYNHWKQLINQQNLNTKSEISNLKEQDNKAEQKEEGTLQQTEKSELLGQVGSGKTDKAAQKNTVAVELRQSDSIGQVKKLPLKQPTRKRKISHIRVPPPPPGIPNKVKQIDFKWIKLF